MLQKTSKNYLIYLIPPALFLFFLTPISLIHAQNEENPLKQNDFQQFLFGCSNLADLLHCDPLVSEVKSNHISAKSKMIYVPRDYGSSEEFGAPIVSMVFSKDGRLFFSEKETGNIRILLNDEIIKTPFVHIPNIHSDFEQGMLGLTLDPDFEQNHFLYVYHTYNDTETNTIYNRIVRFVDDNNSGTDPTIILDKIPAGVYGMHSGGALTFGLDGKLYVTVGDRFEPDSAQDLSQLTGKILRINKDGTIPSDNPFNNSPVFTYGHRNMFGIAFDTLGTGIVTENGDVYYDEINQIHKGHNYGWPIQQPANQPPEISHSSTKPIRSYWKTQALTQAIFYNNEKFPILNEKFLFGSYNPQKLGIHYNDWSSNIFSLDLKDNGSIEEYVISSTHQGPVLGIAQSPEGDIYYGGWHIYKLVSLDNSILEPSLYQTEITGVDNVNEVQFFHNEKKLVLNVERTQTTQENISIKIDSEFLGNIKQVTDDSNELKFDLKQTEEYTNIEFYPISQNIFQINITGDSISKDIIETTEISIFPALYVIIIITIIIFVVILFQKRRKLIRYEN